MKVAIIGFGTVGSGTARILIEHREEIRRKAGMEIEIAAVCSRKIAAADTGFLPATVRRVADWRDALATPGVEIVAELIGGVDAAAEVVTAALRAGLTVVTANKNLLAARGPELEALAAEAGAGLECEASVAGGIPVLAAIREGLAAERIQALYGILNGTCNYVLTTMESAGSDMPQALAEAQKLGYAEADPSADVEGWDTRFKLAILARLSFGGDVPLDSIVCRGITRISSIDFAYAHRLGCTIRLIGAARREAAGLHCFVRPLLIPATHMLAKVQGAYNGARAARPPASPWPATSSARRAIARRAPSGAPRRWVLPGRAARPRSRRRARLRATICASSSATAPASSRR
jgi:homoserine dehydrogenase